MISNHLGRLLEAPRQSFFLFGPRGVGKSTWTRHAMPAAHVIDLLDETRYLSLLAGAGQFAAELQALPGGSWVVVDEIQRIPALLQEVHRFIEARRLKFVLCGSSARKLKTAGTNLLAGRALVRHLHPFVPRELGRSFDLGGCLRHGTLPVVLASELPEETLRAYVQTYLREEIKAEALVRNLPGFVRFLSVAGLFHGQTLNTSSLARDAAVSRTTVEGYLEVLEDTLLAFRLPGFEARLRARERRHPKLYLCDPGVARALRNERGELHADEAGPLFEGWVAALLRAYRDYHDLFDEWGYWAPAEATRTEVDFVLKRGRSLVAIEAKSSSRIGPEDLKGLRAMEGMRGLRRRLLVYRGARSLVPEPGLEVWPVARFLDALDSGSIW